MFWSNTTFNSIITVRGQKTNGRFKRCLRLPYSIIIFVFSTMRMRFCVQCTHTRGRWLNCCTIHTHTYTHTHARLIRWDLEGEDDYDIKIVEIRENRDKDHLIKKTFMNLKIYTAIIISTTTAALYIR